MAGMDTIFDFRSACLAFFDLQVTPMLPTKFGVNWPFGSEEEAKIRFSRWGPWRPFWFSDRHDLAILIYESPQCFLPSLESICLSVQEKKRKIDFQGGGHGGHLRFPIGTILIIYDLQVTPMLPTKYPVNWPGGVEGVSFFKQLLTPLDGQQTLIGHTSSP